MRLALSLGLFSSNDVDSGTLLLLKTLAKETDLTSFKNIVDIGCGVGTIGLSLKKYLPQASVLLRDRDALAVDFSSYNSEINKIEGVQIEQELFLNGLKEKYDLIVTNIPAKAGEEVIKDFFLRSPSYLTDNGLVAMVIVAPLRKEAESLLESCSLECLYQEHTKMHSVYHYRRAENIGEDEGLSPYIRNRSDYELGGQEYTLDTVYNIPDFDMVGWKHQLAARLLKHQNKGGTWCFWNPGQGHIPAFFDKKCSPGADKIILTGRDLLQCRITAHNLDRQGFNGDCQTMSVSHFSQLCHKMEADSLDLFVVDLDKPIPRTDWHSPLKETGIKLLKKGGLLALYGKSNDLHLFMKGHKGYTPLADERHKGNRCVILKRN